MKKIFYFLICIHCAISFAYEKGLKCPPQQIIKRIHLTEANINTFDADIWNFKSTPFTYDNVEWYVFFGGFFPKISLKAEALIKGQEFFDHATIAIPHPRLIKIPHFYLCDYMPNGREYWISAETPIS